MFDTEGNQKVDRLVVRRSYKKVAGRDLLFDIVLIEYDNASKEWKIQVDRDSKRLVTYPDDLLRR